MRRPELSTTGPQGPWTPVASGLPDNGAHQWTVAAAVHLVHLSNGQGLGEHNPAFDGLGGAVELSWTPPGQPANQDTEKRPTPPPIQPAAPDTPARRGLRALVDTRRAKHPVQPIR